MRCPLFDYCSLSRCVGSGKITTEQLLAFLTSLNLLALFFFFNRSAAGGARTSYYWSFYPVRQLKSNINL